METSSNLLPSIGSHITVRGLKNRPEWNGRTGTVVCHYTHGQRAGRCGVRLGGMIDGGAATTASAALLPANMQVNTGSMKDESRGKENVDVRKCWEEGKLEAAKGIASMDGTSAEEEALEEINNSANKEEVEEGNDVKNREQAEKKAAAKVAAAARHAAEAKRSRKHTRREERNAGVRGEQSSSANTGCAVCHETGELAEFGRVFLSAPRLFGCSKCDGPRLYCSERCFRTDWEEGTHKAQCSALKQAREGMVDARRAMADAVRMSGEADEVMARARSQRRGTRNDMASCAIGLYSDSIAHAYAAIEAAGRRSDLGCCASRIAASSACKASAAQLIAGDASAAAAFARDALVLDAGSAQEALKHLRSALQRMGKDRAADVANRQLEIVSGPDPCGMCKNLLHAELISSSEFNWRNERRVDKILATERNRGGFPDPRNDGRMKGKWGLTIVLVSLVPFREQQWLSFSLNSPTDTTDDHTVMNSSLICADPEGDPDDVDTVNSSGKKSNTGSEAALIAAREAIPKYVRQVEAKGLAVISVVLGAGLCGLAPAGLPDPPGLDLPPCDIAESLEVSPFQMSRSEFPEYTIIMPALNHVSRDVQHDIGQMAERMGRDADFARSMGEIFEEIGPPPDLPQGCPTM